MQLSAFIMAMAGIITTSLATPLASRQHLCGRKPVKYGVRCNGASLSIVDIESCKVEIDGSRRTVTAAWYRGTKVRKECRGPRDECTHITARLLDNDEHVNEVTASEHQVALAIQCILNECHTSGGSVEVQGYEDMIIHVGNGWT